MIHLPEDNTEKSELTDKRPEKVQAIAAVATDNWGTTTLRREDQFYRKQRFGNPCNGRTVLTATSTTKAIGTIGGTLWYETVCYHAIGRSPRQLKGSCLGVM
jgi:hypothetical protein